MPAQTAANIPFTLDVPTDATPGDHAGGVALNEAIRAGDQGGTPDSNIDIAGRDGVGARIYLRSRAPSKRAWPSPRSACPRARAPVSASVPPPPDRSATGSSTPATCGSAPPPPPRSKACSGSVGRPSSPGRSRAPPGCVSRDNRTRRQPLAHRAADRQRRRHRHDAGRTETSPQAVTTSPWPCRGSSCCSSPSSSPSWSSKGADPVAPRPRPRPWAAAPAPTRRPTRWSDRRDPSPVGTGPPRHNRRSCGAPPRSRHGPRRCAVGGAHTGPGSCAAHPGAGHTVTGAGWEPGEFVSVQVCGNDGVNGSADCDVANAESFYTERAEFRATVVVTVPPAAVPVRDPGRRRPH